MPPQSGDRNPLEIAIIGGGIGGVITAKALLNQGIRVKLYEQAQSLHEVGAGIGFGKNSQWALRLIDPALYDTLMRVIKDNDPAAVSTNTWFDFYTGMNFGGVAADTYIESIQIDEGNAQCNTSRADLLTELVKLLPQDAICLNKRVNSISQDDPRKVLIRFTDETIAEADAVIGCDGIRSTCRAFVLDGTGAHREPVFTSKYAYRGLIPRDVAVEDIGEDGLGSRRMYLGHHGHVLYFSVKAGSAVNVTALKEKEDGIWTESKWIEPVTTEEVVKDFAGFTKTPLKLLEAIQKPERWAIHDLEPLPTWHKDRLCLLGDSAHASSPHYGAGAGMAVEDAYVLSNLLGRCEGVKDIKRAFEAYEKIRLPRTRRTTESSRAQGRFYDLEQPRQWADGKLNLNSMAHDLRNTVRFIWDENLEGELAEALHIFEHPEIN